MPKNVRIDNMPNRQFPPSLNAVGEYKSFLKRHGTPIACGQPVESFEFACSQRPYSNFAELFKKWVPGNADAPKHWPALAYAVFRYDFRNRELHRDWGLTSPTDIEKLLSDMHKQAGGLARTLGRLQLLSDRISDGAKPEAQAHLAHLNHVVSQAVAGLMSPQDGPENPFVEIGIAAKRRQFTAQLVYLEAGAKEALDQADQTQLSMPRLSKDRALKALVQMAKPIWQSLTNRVPSVNKVSSNSRGEVPDFVTFIQDLVEIANLAPLTIHGRETPAHRSKPTFKQVVTAFGAE